MMLSSLSSLNTTNPNDRQRINKLLKALLKEDGICSYEACDAISNWNDPAFEWYAKAACQATIKQEYYDADEVLQLLWRLPCPLELPNT